MTMMNPAKAVPATIDLAEAIHVKHSEIYALPDGVLGIRVMTGIAWITSKTEDHILEAGESLLISPQRSTVIVNAIGHRPLSIELHKMGDIAC